MDDFDTDLQELYTLGGRVLDALRSHDGPIPETVRAFVVPTAPTPLEDR